VGIVRLGAKDQKGFTLAEALIAVAILLVLLMLLIPAIANLQKNMRQNELDSKAEVLYAAVQNKLTAMSSSGYADEYQDLDDPLLVKLPDTPCDRAAELDESGELVQLPDLYAMTDSARGTEGSVCYYVMTDDVADSELIKHHWVVEYAPDSGSVYAVYYSEEQTGSERDLSDYASNWATYDDLRSRDKRFDDGARVGYYGGDTAVSGDTSTLKPTITITNKEKLEAAFYCTRPGTGTGDDLVFTIKLSDSQGHSRETVYKYNSANNLRRVGKSYYVRIVLDDLSAPDKRFDAVYGSGSHSAPQEQLIAGDELNISLKVESPDRTIESKTVTAKTNSLFADASNSSKNAKGANNEAVIEYGRHLQNLDMLESASGNFKVTTATINRNISFNETSDKDDWYHTYCKDGELLKTYFNGNDSATGLAKFKPVGVTTLNVLEGNNAKEGGGYVISGLNIAEEGDAPAGLFAESKGSLTLRNVSLVGAHVSGGSDTGALVGRVSGQTNYIHDCRVYLSDAQGDLDNKTYNDIWISGVRTGGLVGSVELDASLGMSNNLAATVQYGAAASGGLVGSVSGTLYAEKSYADSYVHGDASSAGLVGVSSNGAQVTFENCYAVGFLYGSQLAGLSNGAVTKATGTYTVVSGSGMPLAYSTAPTIDQASGVYYLHAAESTAGDASGTYRIGNMGSAELLAALSAVSNAYTSDTTTTTHPYNLAGQALTAYAYPRLKVNDHYGDWEADFKSGGLVYYEQYASGGYGFFGADVDSTLSDWDTIVGDGYGIVYRVGDPLPETANVTVEGFSSYTISPASGSGGYFQVYGTDGAEYHVYPLPREMVNVVLDDATGFFWRVQVDERILSQTTNVYYFNPHFAKTARVGNAENDVRPALSSGERISVRTPRQLYNLSLYYDSYADATSGCTFYQERDIYYSEYDWNSYFREGVYSVTRQEPIGGYRHFIANYNGNCYRIGGIDFITDDADYIGLFGFNEGRLENIVVTWDYTVDGTHRYAHRMSEIGANQHVYFGILAGYNGEGAIVDNCAVAGYSYEGTNGTISAYSNSNLYVGGLVGGNEGDIYSSSADCPVIRLSTLNAEAYAGGFVGINYGTGNIVSCYNLGHVETSFSRGGNVRLSGFAGYNQGAIRSSYCATSLNANGEASHTYAFSPLGGIVSSSVYLSDGTFSYVGTLRSYNYDPGTTTGQPVTRNVMCGQRGTSWAVDGYVYDFGATDLSDYDGYPYRAVVSDRSGNWVHYGNWQDEANLGTLGVFYWEHEEHGTNDGYHITFIGAERGGSMKGTTLCTAHDDEGLITEYGYGYFARSDEAINVESSLANMAYSGTTVNEEAQASIQTQMGGAYTFYPYTTRLESEAGGGDYLYLSTDNASVREGTWTLRYGDDSYVFQVAPFFANAMSLEGAGVIAGTDGEETNYSETPGELDNKYEVRSLQQLQYINWNSITKNTSQFVNGDTYKNYPYLQYTSSTGKAKQTEADAYAARPRQYWRQTHDLGVAKGTAFNFTPIAASASAAATDNREVVLYAWFGGEYDGGSYKVQNFDITSDSFTVGLFGVTVGADMHDIILYSDQGNTIKRQTPSSGGQVNQSPGAYSLGGLVGVAYDYQTKTTVSTISNCAIAGYNIVDASSQKHRQGGGVVGGLLGVGNVMLERSSAVTDISIECTHDTGAASWGNYIRVGGLMGSAQYSVNDCYSGGSISVAERTINELYADAKGTPVPEGSRARKVDRIYQTHIYIAGIAGSAYTSNYINFTGTGDAYDGKGVFNNCYTYVKLPDMAGTIKGVSYIAGPADRFGIPAASITINNCYYLDMVNRGITYTIPEYWMMNEHYLMTEEDFQDILNGDLHINRRILYPDSGNAQLYGRPSDVDYTRLSSGDTSFLSPAWTTVTTSEGGVSIPGKYSFPGNNAKLAGKDYPFPTVVTQPDLTYGGDVNVHYGTWPLYGATWTEGMADIDIFADMQREGSSAGEAQKTFTLEDPLGELIDKDPSTLKFKFDHAGIAEVSGVTRKDDHTYEVTFTALGEGATTVIAEDTGSSASFVLRVTGELELESVPAQLVGYKNTVSQLTLEARSKSNPSQVYSTSSNGRWEIDDSQLQSLVSLDKTGVNTWNVTHDEKGSLQLPVLFTYTYRGHDYLARLYVPVRTPGSIGVSSDPVLAGDSLAYNEVQRQLSNTIVVGQDAVYEEDEKPELPEGLDADFYLYESISDGDVGGKALAGMVEPSVRLTGTITTAAGATPFDFVYAGTADPENPGFLVQMGNPETDLVSDSNFQYLPCHIRYTGEGTVGKTAITIEFTHEEDVSDAGVATPYSVQASIDVPRYIGTFTAGAGEGRDRIVKGTGTGDITLPDSQGFSKTGYTFSGWSDDVETNLQPGTTYRLVSNRSFEAQWTANPYKVALNPNFQTSDDPVIVDCVYDTSTTLPANEFERDGFRFAGWAKTPNGSVAYRDQASILNLTAEANATVNLYAVWGSKHKLTLDSQATDEFHPTPASQAIDVYDHFSEVTGYTRPTVWAYTVEGWYTEPTGGSKVLRADGTIAGTVEGYTADGEFALDADKTLYAHWTPAKVKLKANGVETAYDIPALIDGTAPYEKPTRTVDGLGYKLDGWYTGNTDDGGTMVIDADGHVVAGKESELTEGRVLHARWTQSPKFHFDPNGQLWNGTENNRYPDKVKIDFDRGDYLKVTMNVSTCKINKADILSFGRYDKLGEWNDSSVMHLQYNAQNKAKTKKVALNNTEKYFDRSENTHITVKIMKDKLLLDDVEVLKGHALEQKYKNMILNEIARTAGTPDENIFGVGSIEGNGRSDASDYIVTVENDDPNVFLYEFD